jgi:GT2 family glycosyltransferase
MDISIVIVNYKTPKLVLDCLNSIQKHSKGFTYEVILIDNSGTKKDLKTLKKVCLPFSFATIYSKNINLGIVGGNNYGASLAHGDFIFFLNSDTILINNAIGELFRVISSNINVGIVGSNLYSPKMKPTHSFVKEKYDLKHLKLRNLLIPSFWRKLIYNTEFNHTKKNRQIDGYISGACLMIRKNLFDEIHGYDPEIFMYADDTLLCYKVKEAGYKMLNVPSSKIIHLEGGSDSKEFTDFKIKNYSYGNYVFFKRAYGDKEATAFLKYMVRFSRVQALRNKLWRKEAAYRNSIYMGDAYQKLLNQISN